MGKQLMSAEVIVPSASSASYWLRIRPYGTSQKVIVEAVDGLDLERSVSVVVDRRELLAALGDSHE